MSLVLVGGGVRSGKTAFALERARSFPARRVYLATAETRDDDMAERARSHRRERGDAFTTVEEPLEVATAVTKLEPDTQVVVVDCLTLWLSNMLLRGDDEAAMLAAVERFVEAVRARACAAVVVTNEVGMGVVPEHPLGRAFRDVSGRAHQRLARASDEVYFAALGMLLRLKPPPLVTL